MDQDTSNEQAYTHDGESINSDFLNGLSTAEAKAKMIAWLEEKGIGKSKVQYKLRDWVFSRQRYWGEPIPLVWCDKCNEWIPLPEKELPLKLPEVKNYQPTDTGESPLAAMTDWVNTKCPKCGGSARRETDTMPNWAGSSWYFLRYCDPENKKELASMKKLRYWMTSGSPIPVGDDKGGGIDWYNGGMEHTVLHLLYSRFWNQFLYDIGVVPTREPYQKRTSHGLILGPDGEKMSKSRGNVINPDDIVAEYGADALRTYTMFMGPFDQAIAWDTNGLVGVRRFLDRVWFLQSKINENMKTLKHENKTLETMLHKTIKKVTEDIEEMRFNTAIAKLMELSNEMNKEESISLISYLLFILLLSPFAPHLCEELWSLMGGKKSIAFEPWPKFDPAKIIESEITLAIQVNGKLRDTIVVAADMAEDEVKKLALGSDKVQKWLEGKTPKKVIYVKGKLVSIVV
jgi:leucyl-tRNA synthetase